MKYEIIIITVLVIVAISGLFIVYVSPTLKANMNQEEQNFYDKAILDAQIYNWGSDGNEIIYQYWLSNYGNVEAKGVSVRIILFDEYSNKVIEDVFDIGNVASQSVEFKESYSNKLNLVNMDKEHILVSIIEDCEDCEMLWKNIPKLVKEYN